MLWPFNRSPGPTIEAIYGMIVAQARLPAFYERVHVPDTVNGRFDMVLLHLWLVLRRLRTCAGGAKASQALLDCFCSDMDANLREMGVGDLTVPKRMLKFAEAFYGRANAYDAALQAEGSDLAQALARNILLDTDVARAGPLETYVRETIQHLEAVSERLLLAGDWGFVEPAAMAQMQEPVS